MPLGTIPMIASIGRPNRLTANGNDIEWMGIGCTVAWPLVDPNATGATINAVDGTPVANGERVIEIGTYMVPLTGGPYKGYYAPFKDQAANGQGVQSQDGGFIDMTIKDKDVYGELVGLIVGGTVWRERLKIVAGLTLQNIRDKFPRLRLTQPEAGF